MKTYLKVMVATSAKCNSNGDKNTISIILLYLLFYSSYYKKPYMPSVEEAISSLFFMMHCRYNNRSWLEKILIEISALICMYHNFLLFLTNIDLNTGVTGKVIIRYTLILYLKSAFLNNNLISHLQAKCNPFS